MRDALRKLDRLDLRVQPRAITWTLAPGTYRVAEATLVVVVLLALVLLTEFRQWGHSLAILLWALGRIALGQLRHRGGVADPAAVDAAMRRLPEIGREVRPGRWRVEGPAARAFAVQLEQWRASGAAPVALAPAEPEHVLAEEYIDGAPWPNPPEALAGPWPLLERREPE